MAGSSPVSHGFDDLNLSGLARVSSKTFERLAPYTSIQNPSLPEARPLVQKVVNKTQAYIEAIDTSIDVVHLTYQMSKIATALWTIPAPSNEKETLAGIIQLQRQKHLKDLVVLADEIHQKAERTTTVFKQTQQDLYKIAALTKDIDCTVQIPVDPTLPQLITKPLKDIGPDLVSNLNLLADFTNHSSNLTAWYGWINSSIAATNGTVVPSQNGSLVDADIIRPKWDKIRADCLIYHSMMSEILHRYSSILPKSSDVWRATMREMDAKAITNAGRPMNKGSKSSHKVSSVLQDAIRHLSCHAQSNFAV